MNFKEHLNNIKAFVFDVDGVLTNGQLILMPDGEQVRQMNIKDGYALQLAVKKGYKVGIISSGKVSEGVRKRLQLLGITDIKLGAMDKTDAFDDFTFSYHLKPEEVMYMGDDMPDYLVMKKAGLAVCPSDAAEDIKGISKYISSRKGGEGCVRDVIEQALRLHGNWE